MAFCQTSQASTLEAGTFLNGESFDILGTATFPAGSFWSLERCLAGQAPGSWYSYASGRGDAMPEAYASIVRSRDAGGFTALFHSFPFVPPPGPPPGSIGYRRPPQFQFFHATLRFQLLQGLTSKVYASWPSHTTPATTYTTVFLQSELDLRDTTNPNANRYPFGAGSITGLLTDTPPIFMSYSIFPLVAGESTPSLSSSTPGDSEAVFREFILSHKEVIRSTMWPSGEYMAPIPSPVSPAQRSFFRLRTTAAIPPDANGDGVPDLFNTWWTNTAAGNNQAPGLMISEACYFRTEKGEGFIGGEAADWVEIWNPTSAPISTAGYSLSKNAAGPGFSLPLVDLDPGKFLIIHCTAKGRSTLVAKNPTSPVLPFTADFDLNDRGEKIYLKIGPPAEAISRNVHVFNPPNSDITFPGGRAIPNISYGIQLSPVYGNNFIYGYFEFPTRDKLLGELNTGLALGFLSGNSPATGLISAAPTVEVFTSPLSAPDSLGGQIFPGGGGSAPASFSVRLRCPDPEAAILYTLNGTEPTVQSAVYDPAQPIVINSTIILRARSMRPGLLPSGVTTRTFIHAPSVPAQIYPEDGKPLNDPLFASTLAASNPNQDLPGPSNPPSSVIYAYRLCQKYTAAGGIQEQLLARPSLCLTMASLKLPVDSDLSTPDGEPVSVEYIDPANPAAYSQENAFIQRSGNHSDGVRQSFNLLFKKGATLSGTPRWNAAKTVTGSSATSAIFPGSPVTSFARLVVRRPSSDAYADGIGSTEPEDTYIRDLWLKETQRATGGLTAQRRWVHLYLNGLYWGLYDLEEHHDEDMISDHLKAKAASGYAAGSLDPDKILFLRDTLDSSSLEAQNSWDSLVSACSAARLAPGDAVSYGKVEEKLDIQDYISYIITSAICGKGKSDYGASQARGWRHPDQRWHLIQWDGDSIGFHDDVDMLLPRDRVTGQAITDLVPDQRPHEHLKFHPTYRAAFDARLRALIRNQASSAGPAGPLSQSNILNRFDLHAGDFRKTLECEIMRWAGSAARSESTNLRAYPANWQNIINASHLDTGSDNAYNTRAKLKVNARESRLLNDIPPPVITISGDVATITRPAGVIGRIYAEKASYIKDPDSPNNGAPEFVPGTAASETVTLSSTENTVTARIFGPDLDGVLSWSALTTYTKP